MSCHKTCSPGCKLDPEHGDDCDGREEALRWRDLFELLDAGVDEHPDLTVQMRARGLAALPS